MKVEVTQDDLQLCHIFCCDCIILHNVSEVKGHCHRLDNFQWDI